MPKPAVLPTRALPSPAALLPLFQELFSRQLLRQFVATTPIRLYWRLLPPLVIVWSLVYQRLQKDHTCDALVSYLHSGAVDQLDRSPQAGLPLSQPLTSESTAAYVQGRNRMPLAVLQDALRHVRQSLAGWVQTETSRQWCGHAVRILDGTTFRLAPCGDLVRTYGQAHNQLGASYWVVVQALASFCLKSQAVVGYAEAAGAASESSLLRTVLAQDEVPHSIYLADRGLGVYRLVQVAHALQHEVVARVQTRVAQRLLHSVVRKRLRSGTECRVGWAPQRRNQLEADLPAPTIAGRLLFVRLERKGFRPLALYLFTTLLDETAYPLAALCELYGWRWHGEIDFRHLKTTLEMDHFDVKSSEMFRKELAAGLLTYNLICAYMVKAALKAGLAPNALSFSRCARRLRELFFHGAPAWVAPDQVETYILERLARCRLPTQPNKVAHEPRKIRRRPMIFPALKGERAAARRKITFPSKTKVRNS